MSLLILTFWIYFQTQEATKSPKPWQTQSLKRSLCSVHERCQLSKRKEYPISHSLNLKGRNTQFLIPSSSTKSNCCGASRRDSLRIPLLPLLSLPLSHCHVNTSSAPGSMPSFMGDKKVSQTRCYPWNVSISQGEEYRKWKYECLKSYT